MADFSQFIGYWERRAHLDPAGWHAFYQLTHRFLAACPVRSFAAELGERKVLIDDFFHDKIFMSAGSDAPAPFGAGALCQYFRRYLVDRTRNAWDAHRVSDEEAGTAYEGCAFTRVDDIDKILADGGLNIESVVAAARDFLAAQEEAERLYLALHTCADEAEALSGLAERHRIASYHYKAKKLGITREKGACEAGYEKTRIGEWLTRTLAVPLTAERQDEILAALKILCLVSLSEWEAHAA